MGRLYNVLPTQALTKPSASFGAVIQVAPYRAVLKVALQSSVRFSLRLRRLISQEHPSFLLIQETQVRDITRNQIYNFWENDQFERFHHPPEGRSGGAFNSLGFCKF